MPADKPVSPDEHYTALFAVEEDALVAGRVLETVCLGETSAEVRQRLNRDLACVQLLRQALGSKPPGADAPGSPPVPWKSLGRFELRHELGRGGFGIVYLAYDPLLHREVALKVPRVEAGLAPELRERFHNEARAAAGLDHPNLVPVYEAGEVGPVCFLVSAYCPGATLAQWLKQRTEPVLFEDAARLLATLAEAVQHAHNRGVVHRDLKPGNVLLHNDERGTMNDEQGRAPASSFIPHPSSFTPKITDFGLAKVTAPGSSEGPTRSGAIVGTVSYMAPEQAAGKTREIGPSADLYALGAILYEFLTGRPPFKDDSELGVLQQVQTREPIPPSRLRTKVPRDLETICLKCLQKEPAWRYPSAGALAEDLWRFVRGEPIQARRVSWPERGWRWCRRNPALATAAACALIALTVAALFGYRSYSIEQQRGADLKAHEEQLLAEKLEKALMAAMSGDFDGAEKAIGEAELHGASTGQVHMLRGQVALHRGETAAAIEHLEQAVQLIPDSVAARAMLTMAYYHTGRTQRMQEVEQVLKTMSPTSPEDFLFKGQVEGLVAPVGMARTHNLDEAVRRRDSVIARVVRAEARANRALFLSDVGEAELAVEDAQLARGMLPDNPFVLTQSVYAHLVAHVLLEALDRKGDSSRVLEQARRDVEKLRRSSSPIAANACVWYFECVGDEQAACEMSRQGSEFRLVPILYRRGDLPQALEAAERAVARTYPLARVERGFVLAELPDGPARARATFQEVMELPDDSRFFRMCAPLLLLLLGEKDQAVQASLQVSQNRSQLPPGHDNWYERYLDYNCGLITTEALLKAAGPYRMKQCEAHFLIGLHHLAKGDRAGAREHFQKCVETRVFIYWDYMWARAFLARMDKDPAWPRWIPSS